MERNSHCGPTLEDFLEEEGMLEEANAYATKRILAWQISSAMNEQGISKASIAKRAMPSKEVAA